jgi:site-specific DNA-cytosine methylase
MQISMFSLEEPPASLSRSQDYVKGLADPRGNLCLTFLAIADRYRPEWLLWENVPGVLSSDGGRDFGAFLGGLGQLGYGWSYRVLDAQYVRVDGFGRAVPQRRRRVFVVGNLRDWRRAAAVLFERESLQGNTAPRRQAGQRVATPKECERLQGFPDGYTDVPWRNKNWTPDGPRYKALGNSMAVNCMRWIGQRIQKISELAGGDIGKVA